jgi:CheY-like chemotaxis protein
MVTSGPHGRWRVLVVDDDQDIHPLIEVMFEIEGHFEVVGHAEEGAEALEMAERLCPDAVVVDLSMPAGMDGWEALPRLRSLLPDARIVVLSNFPELATLVQVLSAGWDAYLNKAAAWELVPVLVQLLGNGSPRPVGSTC